MFFFISRYLMLVDHLMKRVDFLVRPDTPFVRSPESSDDEAKGRSPRDIHQLNPTASTPALKHGANYIPFFIQIPSE